MEIVITKMVAGAITRQYRPQPMGWPLLAAMEVPTTLADAPIGVAFPPMSVPIARVHASTDRSIPSVAARLRITGIMVAAKGILSTNALATADPHRMIAMITSALPPPASPIREASNSSTPVCSKPLITTNRPMKNNSVFQSTCRSNHSDTEYHNLPEESPHRQKSCSSLRRTFCS